jgi:hypothetical protein
MRGQSTSYLYDVISRHPLITCVHLKSQAHIVECYVWHTDWGSYWFRQEISFIPDGE